MFPLGQVIGVVKRDDLCGGGSIAIFDLDWMLCWQQRVNANQVLKVIGKYFDAEICFQFGELQYGVSVKSGSIEKVIPCAMIGSSWDFALRASSEAWEKFIEKTPPPMYNDIWAMAKCEALKIEGNTKKIWQHLRALTWMLDIMRTVG